jgi:hypothetical protein
MTVAEFFIWTLGIFMGFPTISASVRVICEARVKTKSYQVEIERERRWTSENYRACFGKEGSNENQNAPEGR